MPTQRVRKVVLERTEEKKTCPICGKEFWGVKKAKFDSRECRDRDYYIRNEAKIRERQAQAYQQRKVKASKAAKK